MSENLNLKTISTIDPSPFKHLCVTIGELPSTFVESMSYYELLAWFVNYLEKTVIPAVNANGEATAELQELFIELKTFVDTYFDNLDVQEEINNKLDDMAEQGTLQEIITTYIQSNVAWTFDTVADMKLAENLVAGSYAQTLGFHSLNDGGGAIYKITNSGTANELDIIAVGNLYANLIYDKQISVKQLGAYGDGTHDDVDAFKRIIALNKRVYVPNGTYVISEAIGLPNNTEIIGEDLENTIISKTAITSPNAIFNVTGNSRVIIKNLLLECNNLTDYGILATVKFSKFEFNNIKINQAGSAGIYTNNSTYLGSITNVHIFNSNGYGIYLVPSSSSYTNTSVNISHCYVSVSQNAYKINGSYMNMENCCADNTANIVFDLSGYVGSLVSCGSESYQCNYMFYGDNETSVTVVNPKTFASYDVQNSVHIHTGNASNWIFIGGSIAYGYGSQLSKGLGKFIEQGTNARVKFIGCRIRGSFEQPSVIDKRLEINNEEGALFNKGDITYLGSTNNEFGGDISANKLPANAIYLGTSDKPFVINNRRVTSQGTHKGDMFITTSPDKIGGMGWISGAEYSGNLANGTYYKVPVIASGATGDEPNRGLVLGQMYYDTTLNKPKWLTSVGKQQQDNIKFTTAPTTDGTIVLTINGADHNLAVTANMTNHELYEALISSDIEEVVFREGGSTIVCDSKIYKNYGGAMFSINTGTTGAVMTDTVITAGGNPQWKSVTEFS